MAFVVHDDARLEPGNLGLTRRYPRRTTAAGSGGAPLASDTSATSCADPQQLSRWAGISFARGMACEAVL